MASNSQIIDILLNVKSDGSGAKDVKKQLQDLMQSLSKSSGNEIGLDVRINNSKINAELREIKAQVRKELSGISTDILPKQTKNNILGNLSDLKGDANTFQTVLDVVTKLESHLNSLGASLPQSLVPLKAVASEIAAINLEQTFGNLPKVLTQAQENAQRLTEALAEIGSATTIIDKITAFENFGNVLKSIDPAQLGLKFKVLKDAAKEAALQLDLSGKQVDGLFRDFQSGGEKTGHSTLLPTFEIVSPKVIAAAYEAIAVQDKLLEKELQLIEVSKEKQQAYGELNKIGSFDGLLKADSSIQTLSLLVSVVTDLNLGFEKIATSLKDDNATALNLFNTVKEIKDNVNIKPLNLITSDNLGSALDFLKISKTIAATYYETDELKETFKLLGEIRARLVEVNNERKNATATITNTEKQQSELDRATINLAHSLKNVSSSSEEGFVPLGNLLSNFNKELKMSEESVRKFKTLLIELYASGKLADGEDVGKADALAKRLGFNVKELKAQAQEIIKADEDIIRSKENLAKATAVTAKPQVAKTEDLALPAINKRIEEEKLLTDAIERRNFAELASKVSSTSGENYGLELALEQHKALITEIREELALQEKLQKVAGTSVPVNAGNLETRKAEFEALNKTADATKNLVTEKTAFTESELKSAQSSAISVDALKAQTEAVITKSKALDGLVEKLKNFVAQEEAVTTAVNGAVAALKRQAESPVPVMANVATSTPTVATNPISAANAEQLADGTNKLAEADKKLTGESEKATEALSVQQATVIAKSKKLDELLTALGGVTRAEKELTDTASSAPKKLKPIDPSSIKEAEELAKSLGASLALVFGSLLQKNPSNVNESLDSLKSDVDNLFTELGTLAKKGDNTARQLSVVMKHVVEAITTGINLEDTTFVSFLKNLAEATGVLPEKIAKNLESFDLQKLLLKLAESDGSPQKQIDLLTKSIAVHFGDGFENIKKSIVDGVEQLPDLQGLLKQLFARGKGAASGADIDLMKQFRLSDTIAELKTFEEIFATHLAKISIAANTAGKPKTLEQFFQNIFNTISSFRPEELKANFEHIRSVIETGIQNLFPGTAENTSAIKFIETLNQQTDAIKAKAEGLKAVFGQVDLGEAFDQMFKNLKPTGNNATEKLAGVFTAILDTANKFGADLNKVDLSEKISKYLTDAFAAFNKADMGGAKIKERVKEVIKQALASVIISGKDLGSLGDFTIDISKSLKIDTAGAQSLISQAITATKDKIKEKLDSEFKSLREDTSVAGDKIGPLFTVGKDADSFKLKSDEINIGFAVLRTLYSAKFEELSQVTKEGREKLGVISVAGMTPFGDLKSLQEYVASIETTLKSLGDSSGFAAPFLNALKEAHTQSESLVAAIQGSMKSLNDAKSKVKTDITLTDAPTLTLDKQLEKIKEEETAFKTAVTTLTSTIDAELLRVKNALSSNISKSDEKVETPLRNFERQLLEDQQKLEASLNNAEKLVKDKVQAIVQSSKAPKDFEKIFDAKAVEVNIDTIIGAIANINRLVDAFSKNPGLEIKTDKTYAGVKRLDDLLDSTYGKNQELARSFKATEDSLRGLFRTGTTEESIFKGITKFDGSNLENLKNQLANLTNKELGAIGGELSVIRAGLVEIAGLNITHPFVKFIDEGHLAITRLQMIDALTKQVSDSGKKVTEQLGKIAIAQTAFTSAEKKHFDSSLVDENSSATVAAFKAMKEAASKYDKAVFSAEESLSRFKNVQKTLIDQSAAAKVTVAPEHVHTEVLENNVKKAGETLKVLLEAAFVKTQFEVPSNALHKFTETLITKILTTFEGNKIQIPLNFDFKADGIKTALDTLVASVGQSQNLTEILEHLKTFANEYNRLVNELKSSNLASPELLKYYADLDKEILKVTRTIQDSLVSNQRDSDLAAPVIKAREAFDSLNTIIAKTSGVLSLMSSGLNLNDATSQIDKIGKSLGRIETEVSILNTVGTGFSHAAGTAEEFRKKLVDATSETSKLVASFDQLLGQGNNVKPLDFIDKSAKDSMSELLNLQKQLREEKRATEETSAGTSAGDTKIALLNEQIAKTSEYYLKLFELKEQLSEIKKAENSLKSHIFDDKEEGLNKFTGELAAAIARFKELEQVSKDLTLSPQQALNTLEKMSDQHKLILSLMEKEFNYWKTGLGSDNKTTSNAALSALGNVPKDTLSTQLPFNEENSKKALEALIKLQDKKEALDKQMNTPFELKVEGKTAVQALLAFNQEAAKLKAAIDLVPTGSANFQLLRDGLNALTAKYAAASTTANTFYDIVSKKADGELFKNTGTAFNGLQDQIRGIIGEINKISGSSATDPFQLANLKKDGVTAISAFRKELLDTLIVYENLLKIATKRGDKDNIQFLTENIATLKESLQSVSTEKLASSLSNAFDTAREKVAKFTDQTNASTEATKKLQELSGRVEASKTSSAPIKSEELQKQIELLKELKSLSESKSTIIDPKQLQDINAISTEINKLLLVFSNYRPIPILASNTVDTVSSIENALTLMQTRLLEIDRFKTKGLFSPEQESLVNQTTSALKQQISLLEKAKTAAENLAIGVSKSEAAQAPVLAQLKEQLNYYQALVKANVVSVKVAGTEDLVNVQAKINELLKSIESSKTTKTTKIFDETSTISSLDKISKDYDALMAKVGELKTPASVESWLLSFNNLYKELQKVRDQVALINSASENPKINMDSGDVKIAFDNLSKLDNLAKNFTKQNIQVNVEPKFAEFNAQNLANLDKLKAGNILDTNEFKIYQTAINETVRQIKILEEAQKNFGENSIALTPAIDGLNSFKKSIEAAQYQTRLLNLELKSVDFNVNSNPQSVAAQSNAITTLSNAFNTLKTSHAEFLAGSGNQSYADIRTNVQNLVSALSEFNPLFSKISNSVSSAQKEIKSLTDEAGRLGLVKFDLNSLFVEGTRSAVDVENVIDSIIKSLNLTGTSVNTVAPVLRSLFSSSYNSAQEFNEAVNRTLLELNALAVANPELKTVTQLALAEEHLKRLLSLQTQYNQTKLDTKPSELNDFEKSANAFDKARTQLASIEQYQNAIAGKSIFDFQQSEALRYSQELTKLGTVTGNLITQLTTLRSATTDVGQQASFTAMIQQLTDAKDQASQLSQVFASIGGKGAVESLKRMQGAIGEGLGSAEHTKEIIDVYGTLNVIVKDLTNGTKLLTTSAVENYQQHSKSVRALLTDNEKWLEILTKLSTVAPLKFFDVEGQVQRFNTAADNSVLNLKNLGEELVKISGGQSAFDKIKEQFESVNNTTTTTADKLTALRQILVDVLQTNLGENLSLNQLLTSVQKVTAETKNLEKILAEGSSATGNKQETKIGDVAEKARNLINLFTIGNTESESLFKNVKELVTLINQPYNKGIFYEMRKEGFAGPIKELDQYKTQLGQVLVSMEFLEKQKLVPSEQTTAWRANLSQIRTLYEEINAASTKIRSYEKQANEFSDLKHSLGDVKTSMKDIMEEGALFNKFMTSTIANMAAKVDPSGLFKKIADGFGIAGSQSGDAFVKQYQEVMKKLSFTNFSQFASKDQPVLNVEGVLQQLKEIGITSESTLGKIKTQLYEAFAGGETGAARLKKVLDSLFEELNVGLTSKAGFKTQQDGIDALLVKLKGVNDFIKTTNSEGVEVIRIKTDVFIKGLTQLKVITEEQVSEIRQKLNTLNESGFTNKNQAAAALKVLLENLGVAAEHAGTQLKIVFSANLNAQVQRYSEAIKELETQLVRLHSGVITWTMGVQMFGQGLFEPVKKAIEGYKQFSDTMGMVQSITDATDEQYKELTKTAILMGGTTRYTAEQAADGLKFLAMAGYEAEEAIKVLPIVMNMAQTSAMDLGAAAEITTNIMTEFRLTVDEFAQAADVLAMAAAKTNATMQDLGVAFKYVGAVSANIGADFTDLTAAVSLMHNAGIKASMAGTSLRGALNALLNPTKEEAALIQRLSERIGGAGLQVIDTQGKFVGFLSLMKQFEKAGLTSGEALALFGQRAGPGMSALLSIGSEKLEKYEEDLRNSEGMSAKVAQNMAETLKGQELMMKSATGMLGDQFAHNLEGLLKGIYGIITSITMAIVRFREEFPLLAKAIDVAFTAFAGLAVVIGSLAISLSMVVIPTIQFVAFMSTLVVTFGKAIAAAGSLTAAYGAMSAAMATLGNVSVMSAILPTASGLAARKEILAVMDAQIAKNAVLATSTGAVSAAEASLTASTAAKAAVVELASQVQAKSLLQTELALIQTKRDIAVTELRNMVRVQGLATNSAEVLAKQAEIAAIEISIAAKAKEVAVREVSIAAAIQETEAKSGVILTSFAEARASLVLAAIKAKESFSRLYNVGALQTEIAALVVNTKAKLANLATSINLLFASKAFGASLEASMVWLIAHTQGVNVLTLAQIKNSLATKASAALNWLYAQSMIVATAITQGLTASFWANTLAKAGNVLATTALVGTTGAFAVAQAAVTAVTMLFTGALIGLRVVLQSISFLFATGPGLLLVFAAAVAYFAYQWIVSWESIEVTNEKLKRNAEIATANAKQMDVLTNSLKRVREEMATLQAINNNKTSIDFEIKLAGMKGQEQKLLTEIKNRLKDNFKDVAKVDYSYDALGNITKLTAQIKGQTTAIDFTTASAEEAAKALDKLADEKRFFALTETLKNNLSSSVTSWWDKFTGEVSASELGAKQVKLGTDAILEVMDTFNIDLAQRGDLGKQLIENLFKNNGKFNLEGTGLDGKYSKEFLAKIEQVFAILNEKSKGYALKNGLADAIKQYADQAASEQLKASASIGNVAKRLSSAISDAETMLNESIKSLEGKKGDTEKKIKPYEEWLKAYETGKKEVEDALKTQFDARVEEIDFKVKFDTTAIQADIKQVASFTNSLQKQIDDAQRGMKMTESIKTFDPSTSYQAAFFKIISYDQVFNKTLIDSADKRIAETLRLEMKGADDKIAALAVMESKRLKLSTGRNDELRIQSENLTKYKAILQSQIESAKTAYSSIYDAYKQMQDKLKSLDEAHLNSLDRLNKLSEDLTKKNMTSSEQYIALKEEINSLEEQAIAAQSAGLTDKAKALLAQAEAKLSEMAGKIQEKGAGSGDISGFDLSSTGLEAQNVKSHIDLQKKLTTELYEQQKTQIGANLKTYEEALNKMSQMQTDLKDKMSETLAKSAQISEELLKLKLKPLNMELTGDVETVARYQNMAQQLTDIHNQLKQDGVLDLKVNSNMAEELRKGVTELNAINEAKKTAEQSLKNLEAPKLKAIEASQFSNALETLENFVTKHNRLSALFGKEFAGDEGSKNLEDFKSKLNSQITDISYTLDTLRKKSVDTTIDSKVRETLVAQIIELEKAQAEYKRIRDLVTERESTPDKIKDGIDFVNIIPNSSKVDQASQNLVGELSKTLTDQVAEQVTEAIPLMRNQLNRAKKFLEEFKLDPSKKRGQGEVILPNLVKELDTLQELAIKAVQNNPGQDTEKTKVLLGMLVALRKEAEKTNEEMTRASVGNATASKAEVKAKQESVVAGKADTNEKLRNAKASNEAEKATENLTEAQKTAQSTTTTGAAPSLAVVTTPVPDTTAAVTAITAQKDAVVGLNQAYADTKNLATGVAQVHELLTGSQKESTEVVKGLDVTISDLQKKLQQKLDFKKALVDNTQTQNYYADADNDTKELADAQKRSYQARITQLAFEAQALENDIRLIQELKAVEEQRINKPVQTTPAPPVVVPVKIESPKIEQVEAIKPAIETPLSNLKAMVTVALNDLSPYITQVNALVAAIAELKNKEITITVNQKVNGDDAGPLNPMFQNRKFGGLIHGFKTGGVIPGFEEGGMFEGFKRLTDKVPGSGTGDVVPAMLEPGEYIIPKDTVKSLGTRFFDKLKNGLIQFRDMGGMIYNAPVNAFNKISESIKPNYNLPDASQLQTSPTSAPVDIRLTIGNKPFNIKTPRDEVDTLVSALKHLERGLSR